MCETCRHPYGYVNTSHHDRSPIWQEYIMHSRLWDCKSAPRACQEFILVCALCDPKQMISVCPISKFVLIYIQDVVSAKPPTHTNTHTHTDKDATAKMNVSLWKSEILVEIWGGVFSCRTTCHSPQSFLNNFWYVTAFIFIAKILDKIKPNNNNKSNNNYVGRNRH